jgi:hypothetical protein
MIIIMIINNNGAKIAQVGNEQQFLVGLCFMNKDVYLGDLFAVTKMVTDKVESGQIDQEWYHSDYMCIERAESGSE